MKNVIPWKCHLCGRLFETRGGGICKECKEVTCNGCFTVAKMTTSGESGIPFSKVCRACSEEAK